MQDAFEKLEAFLNEKEPNPLSAELRDDIALIMDRRDFHAHPEEGWCEFRTTAKIVEELRRSGFEVLMGESVISRADALGRNEALVARAQADALASGVNPSVIAEMKGLTGCVGIWRSGRPGPVTALRFDIDALAGVTESTSPSHRPTALGFASPKANVMHACGHDGHAAVGLGVARWIANHAEELAGTVKLLFQPAEEGVRGAAAMAASGIVDDCDWLVGAHVGCEFTSGEIGVLTEGYLATTKMDVHFKGIPAHAGSDPEKGRSALLAACAAVMSIQGISRHSGGDSRISVGRIEAGEGRNVIAAHGTLQLEVRGATQAVNDYLEAEVKRIVAGMAAGYAVEAEVIVTGRSCRYVCDPETVAMMVEAVESVKDIENGVVQKVETFTTERGSEDCAVLAERVREKGGKAGFFCYGCLHCGHHRPDFDIEDEEALLAARSVFAAILLRTNGRS